MIKVKLVVASGAHAGKVIPVAGPKFMIGRDPSCQLRPASMAISKLHCAIQINEGTAVITDFGSTNGTIVNGKPVRGECELKNGDQIAIGPLEFTVNLSVGSKSNATPIPAELRAAPKPAPGKSPTPAPRPSPLGAEKPVPAPAPPKSQPIPKATPNTEDPDHIAAMLLGMEDEDVPTGSTAIGIPALTDADIAKIQSEAEKKKKPASSTDSSVLAGDILKKLRGGR